MTAEPTVLTHDIEEIRDILADLDDYQQYHADWPTFPLLTLITYRSNSIK